MENISCHSIISSKVVDAIFSETRSLLILTDDLLTIVKTSLSATILFGEPLEFFPGKNFASLLAPESRRIVGKIKEDLNINGETSTTHLSILDCAGSPTAFFCSIRYLVCEEIEKRFVLFIMRALEATEQSNFKNVDVEYTLKRFLIGHADSVLLIDFKERAIIDCNAGAESMFGYTKQELIGRSPKFLSANQDEAIEHAKKSISSYAQTGFYLSQISCKRKDGLQFQSIATNFAIFDEMKELRFIVAINRDISAQVSRIQELHRINVEYGELTERMREVLAQYQADQPSFSLSELGLTRKQVHVASKLFSGDPIKAIARQIGISEPGVKNHLTVIYRCTGVSSRVEFIKFMQDNHVRIE
jgi:PAS domain S-box-containing protein